MTNHAFVSNHQLGTDERRIKNAVYRTIQSLSDILPAGHNLEAHDSCVLLGSEGILDSMGFVNFVIALEEELERELDRQINMADLLNVQTEDGHTVSTVSDLIELLCLRLG